MHISKFSTSGFLPPAYRLQPGNSMSQAMPLLWTRSQDPGVAWGIIDSQEDASPDGASQAPHKLWPSPLLPAHCLLVLEPRMSDMFSPHLLFKCKPGKRHMDPIRESPMFFSSFCPSQVSPHRAGWLQSYSWVAATGHRALGSARQPRHWQPSVSSRFCHRVCCAKGNLRLRGFP